MKPVILCNIKGIPKEYADLPFGRQLDFAKQIEEWKKTANSIHLSQKRQSYKKAIREFKELYDPTEYFTKFHADKDNYWDDSFQVFYKQKQETA